MATRKHKDDPQRQAIIDSLLDPTDPVDDQVKQKRKYNYKFKPGRPSKYRPEYCQKLIDHMSQGYSFESFAGTVFCSKELLHDWANEHPDFIQAKKVALSLCRRKWEEWGVAGMFQGKNFNAVLWIFNMKNRFSWKDQPESDESTPRVTNINFVEMKYDPNQQQSEGENRSGQPDSSGTPGCVQQDRPTADSDSGQNTEQSQGKSDS